MKLAALRSGLISIVFFSGVTGLAQSPKPASQDPPKEPTAKSIVRGQAIFDDNGQPAAGERIQLVFVEVLGARRGKIPTVMTDVNGEFVFRSVDAGEYYVVAQPVDAHVSSAESAPMPLQTGDPSIDALRLEQFKRESTKIIVSGEPELRIDLRVRNPHFGSISGRVDGADGNPAVGAQVNLATRSASSGENVREFGAHAVTDAQGSFRFRGLPAGEYTLSANPPAARTYTATGVTIEGALGATYFPSTLESANSPAVNVASDGETPNVNITLVSRKLHTASGVVRMQEDGRPIRGAVGRVYRREDPNEASNRNKAGVMDSAMSNYFFTTDKTGRWSIANLPAGTYLINVTPAASPPDRESADKFVMKRQTMTVEAADLEDVVIEVSKGARISGTVIVEGNRPLASLSLLAARTGRGVESSQSASLTVRPAGQVTQFLLTEVPEGEIQLSGFARPNSFYIKSIDLNGVDLVTEKLEIAPSAEVKDVHIVVSSEVAEFSGRILSADGKPLARVSVLLVPVLGKRRVIGGQITGATNEQGAFSITPPPGEYRVEVRSMGNQSGDSRPIFENPPQIVLQAGERKVMDIRLP